MTHYTNEYKAAALKLSDEIGIKRASAELGISYYTIGNWRRERKAGKQFACSSISVGQFVQRIRELEQENTTLRQTNKLLLEALTVSSGEQQPTAT